MKKLSGTGFNAMRFYTIMDKAFESMPDFKYARHNDLMDDVLQTKIMLAVTEVNGCEMCRVYHTQHAKKIGLEEDEINQISSEFVIDLDDAIEAMLFGKRYAENEGTYTDKDWEQLLKIYGEKKALGILAATRMITMGNAMGIAAGNFWSRLKFQPVKGSKLINELLILFACIPFPLIIGFKNLFKKIFGENR
ncbi:MAG: carboxymuconolactone decarboxylase family protein [Thermotogota bacterium]|nr:carboxymuconolactone decarboxylase family protein [Thermotogota bacterium]